MATYVNDLRLKEIATGDESGTWGTSTNTNLELIGEALGYATQQVFSSDADATTTVADGASDPARAMYFKITSAVSLTATRTCTIAPNTVSRVMFIENATSGSQSIAISQGSGANVTIAAGKTAVVYLDGAGSGAAVVDAMAGVDPGVTDTLTEVLVAGNTSGGTNIELTTTDKVQFRDSAIYINSSADGQLDLVADTEIQIAATTVDLNGNLDVSGTALVTGVLTTTAATVFNGGFASNADSTLGTDKKVQFRDSAIYINSSADGQLDIVADTEIQIAATTIDINGAINASGEIIAASLDISGDIDVDGTTNLDVVDIDGAVDMASTLTVGGNTTILPSSDGDALIVGKSGGANLHFFSNAGASLITNAAGAGAARDGFQITSGNVLTEIDTVAKLSVSAAEVVVNDTSADTDFRVESDSNAHMLFVDASTNRVGINASIPEATLDVKTELAITEVASPNATSQLNFYSRFSDSQRGFVVLKAESLASGSSDLVINARNSFTDGERLRIASTGDVTFTGNVTGVNNLTIANQIMHTGDTSNYMQFHQADGWRIVNSTGERFHIQGASVVFNHDGHDADFRVESSGNANMLFVDAGNNIVKIGDSATSTGTSFTANTGRIDAPSGSASLILGNRNNNTNLTNGSILSTISFFGYFSSAYGGGNDIASILGVYTGDGTTRTGELRFRTINAGTEKIKLTLGTTEAVFNDESVDYDFRVESNGNAHMLFVDASAEAVIIGNNAKRTTGGFDPALTIDDNKNAAFFRNNSGGAIQGMQSGGTTGAQNFMLFYNQAGTNIGSVQTSNGNAGTTVSYNTSSDARLKENIADAGDAGELIDAIQVRQFDWIEDGTHQRYGMVAQELNAVAPEAVSAPENPDEMMGVDYSKLVPMMLKEIQSLRARINALEAE